MRAMPKNSSNKNISSINIGSPKFLDEQCGPFEDKFKERLSLMFDRIGCVSRAYLLRVTYEGGLDYGVLLGLIADEKKMASLTPQVGKVFADLFSSGECLDIVLLDKDTERDAAAVCRPFYGT